MRIKAYTPDLWDVMKMVLKGKLYLQVFTRKLENTQRNIKDVICNLIKTVMVRPQISSQKQLIRIRIEINDMEIKIN